MGLWIKNEDGTIERAAGGGVDGADGLPGADGVDGQPGVDGNLWHVGSGAPDPTLGEPGDYYLDGEDGWVYVKRSDSSWTNLYVNLTGPPGTGGGGGDFLPLSGGTVTGGLQVDGMTTLTGLDAKPNGASSSTNPNITFGTSGVNAQTGFYRNSTGAIQVACEGVNVVRFGLEKLNLYNDLQVDGQIKAQNGTAAAPAYSFQSDTNTGMYWYAAGQLGFAAGGKRRMLTGSTGTELNGPNRGESNKSWGNMQLRIMSENANGNESNNSHVGISLWSQRGGFAPIMRVHDSGGEGIGFTNSANSAFIDVFAGGVVIPTQSTLKRNIKTVQDDAVISLAEKWLMAEFDRQVGPKSVRLKPEVAVRQAALLEAGEEPPPVDTADYESVDHDCALDLCDGTPENPCPIIVNHRSEWGGIAEWWGEVAPQQVVFNEEGNATGIRLEQVAATALGAVGALSRRLTDSLDRIDALEARIETLEGN